MFCSLSNQGYQYFGVTFLRISRVGKTGQSENLLSKLKFAELVAMCNNSIDTFRERNKLYKELFQAGMIPHILLTLRMEHLWSMSFPFVKESANLFFCNSNKWTRYLTLSYGPDHKSQSYLQNFKVQTLSLSASDMTMCHHVTLWIHNILKLGTVSQFKTAFFKKMFQITI